MMGFRCGNGGAGDFQLGEGSGGLGGEEDVEVGVDGEGFLEVGSGLLLISESGFDKAGVVLHEGVAGAHAEGLGNLGLGLPGLVIFEESPGEGVGGVDVVADFEFPFGRG